jgi:plastocyanin
MTTGNETMMGGNMTSNMSGNATTGANQTASPGSTVIIAPGSSVPNNAKFYEPPTLTVTKGTTVTWKNADSTLHTVTSGTAEGGESGTVFDSSYMAAGKTFQWTFSDAGTFDYYCTLHPYMKGQVVVN